MKKAFLIMIISLFLTSSMAYASQKMRGKRFDFKKENHVKTMVIFDERHPLYNPFGGIHHVYVNSYGLSEVKKDGARKFPEKSKLIFVLYEHKLENGAYVEGNKKITAYMIKDTNKYKDTDGWGYFAWDANGKNLIKDAKADCHSCHGQVKEKDFIFSVWKE